MAPHALARDPARDNNADPSAAAPSTPPWILAWRAGAWVILPTWRSRLARYAVLPPGARGTGGDDPSRHESTPSNDRRLLDPGDQEAPSHARAQSGPNSGDPGTRADDSAQTAGTGEPYMRVCKLVRYRAGVQPPDPRAAARKRRLAGRRTPRRPHRPISAHRGTKQRRASAQATRLSRGPARSCPRSCARAT